MKYLSFILLSTLTACAPEVRTPFVELCAQTVRDYGILRDEGPAESYADLFTPDGEFHLGPNVTKGREALIARHIASNADTVWRHNMTDIRITEPKEGLTGVTRFHIFMGPRSDKAGQPSREIIGDYIDQFVMDGTACKIESRKVKIVFDTSN